MAWRPHVLRSGARFTAKEVASPQQIDDPVPTEVIERGMALEPNRWGRDKDCMAGIVANGNDIQIKVGKMSGRVGIRAAGCNKLRIHIDSAENALFLIRMTDCTNVFIRVNYFRGLLPRVDEHDHGHILYIDRSRDVRTRIGEVYMAGNDNNTYGTMSKFVLCDDVDVNVEYSHWEYGHLEFEGCRNVLSSGGEFISTGSTLNWGGPLTTIRNRDQVNEPFRSCQNVLIRNAKFYAGAYKTAMLMHSNYQDGHSTPLTTPRWDGSRIDLPHGVSLDTYASNWPGLAANFRNPD